MIGVVFRLLVGLLWQQDLLCSSFDEDDDVHEVPYTVLGHANC